jgi:hypothetical protein
MKSITRRVMVAAGALAMAGGLMGAAAVPASASPADTVAYAVQSDGPFGFVPPIGFTSSPGPGFAHLTAIPLFGFVGLAGVTDRAHPDFASSDIASVSVKVPHDGSPVLWAYNVEASCNTNNDGDASGDTYLQLGRIWFGNIPFFLPTDPDPDTWYHVPGFGAVELNHQHIHNDGDITVTAIRVFTHGQRVSIGVVRCEGDNPS